MKKYFLNLILLLSLVHCTDKPQQNKAPYNLVEQGDNTPFNYDNLSPDIIEYGAGTLAGFKYKFPDYTLFSKRISEVYQVNIDEYINSIIALRMSDFPEIAIKKKSYVLIQDSDTEAKYAISPDILYHYNQYIFYKDHTALKILKMRDPYLVKDLVLYYGYNEDKDLVDFALKGFDFSNATSFHELIFGRRNKDQQFILRKGIINDIEQIIYKGKTKELLSEVKEGNGYDSLGEILNMMYKNPLDYAECEKNIAFLLEKSLNVGDIGDVQSFINKNKSFINKLEHNNFYDNERLKAFCENLEIFNGPSEDKTINDPDGYTNLRKDKNTSSEVLQKVKSGESVKVLDQNGDWWLVETKDGQQGYIHKSRIQ
ncbi:MAG: SH3 domain-containing protein [Chryseobacterium sp.]|uniref:SH3 domain-containing protein n=1 Tax=Chryseobacterium sp. TaxID=1871047 RepID=UPI00282F05FB|nr:SH3 domain-containing protein [Chryseobacterium sp.]MDR2238725.1 SH3 domain-containing protein [Chryseobacterium sp.]